MSSPRGLAEQTREDQPMPSAPVRILTFATAFPNPTETEFGVFIYRRMREVATLTPVHVVAPIPYIQYGNPLRKIPDLAHIPRRREEPNLPIEHPRLFYPPFAGPLVSAFQWGFMLPVFRSLARSFRFDVIDAHFAHPEGVAAVMLGRTLGKPVVITLRGIEVLHAEQYPMRRRSMAWALRNAARVIAVSERLREFALSLGCPPERALTIPNGIDGDVFHPSDPLEARREFRLDPAERYILSAGYLIERKGHHRIAEALGRLKESGTRATLLIAGAPGREGDYENAIHEAVARAGVEDRVRFLGALKPDKLARLMSAVDVFCLASSNEGWPNVLHEAMACGAPVVATDVGAVPQMVPSEDVGYVIPFGDTPRLADGLERALSKPWKRAAIAGWAQRRTWTGVAGEVLEVMRQVVAEHKRGKGLDR